MNGGIGMVIRNFKLADYEEVYQLWKNTPGMGLNNIDDSREGIEQYVKRNPTTCFVATNNQEIVGAILSGHDGRRGFIYHLAVSMSFRMQGIGKKLVDAAINALEKEGIHKVALVAFSENIIGNSFWESQNFVVREDLTYRNKSIQEYIL